MDDARFDRLARTLGALRSRRAATALLGGLIAAPVLTERDSDARKKHKKKKGKGKKGNGKNKPPTTQPPTTPRPCSVRPTDNLQAAIDAALAGSTLALCAGTWNVTTTLVINKSLTLIGAGIDQTVLDGGDTVRVLSIAGNNPVTLQDLTVTRGRAVGTLQNLTDVYGGGIRMSQADVTLRNIAVTNNAAGYGGGIYRVGGALVLAAGTRVSGNKAINGPNADDGGDAGGILILGGGSVTLQAGSSVTNNQAEFTGGGIVNGGSATVTLNPGSTVTGNTPLPNCIPTSICS